MVAPEGGGGGPEGEERGVILNLNKFALVLINSDPPPPPGPPYIIEDQHLWRPGICWNLIAHC